MITVEKLFQSYGSYLRAKVQEKEFGSFGGGLDFRKTMAEHQAIEEQYVREQLAERQESDRALKAGLDEFDAKQQPRRLR